MKTTETLEAVPGMNVLIVTNGGAKIPAQIIRVSPSKRLVAVKTTANKHVVFVRRLTDMRYRSNREIIGYLKEIA